MNHDIIFLEGLEVEAVIGIYEWEQRIRQVVRIDLQMATDIRQAARTDSIQDTLNYKAVTKRIIELVEHGRFQLVETLAERIAGILVDEFALPWVKVTASKPGAIRQARNVGVIIERGTIERGTRP